MNITLTGNLGGGKTSVCKELEKMGYKIISGGSIFRDVANEKGITVTEMNILAKTDPSIDKLIDDRTTKLGKELDNVIFDSRLAWNFAPQSFKVFLLTDPTEAARRVYDGGNREAESYSSYEEALSKLSERANLERDRFKMLYDIDYFDKNNYNLIIESTNATPLAIAKEIIRNFEEYKITPFNNRVELNVGTLYPVVPISSIGANAGVQNESDDSSLCIINDNIEICHDNGYNFVVNGINEFFNGIKAKKVFCQIDGFTNTKSNLDKISILSSDELKQYEKEGNYSYRQYPDILNSKPTYTIDLSKTV